MNSSEARHGINVGVLILAAGASLRMGQQKMLLPWRGTSVLGHLIRIWAGLKAQQIAVVCVPDSPVVKELDRLGFPVLNRIFNLRPETGMFGSITCAARWTGWEPGISHQAIVLGDQPHLESSTLQQLIFFAATHPSRICQPLRNGRPRHPVLIPSTLFRSIPDMGGQTLREFLDRHSSLCTGLALDDPGLDLDLDRPEDYLAAKQRYEGID